MGVERICAEREKERISNQSFHIGLIVVNYGSQQIRHIFFSLFLGLFVCLFSRVHENFFFSLRFKTNLFVNNLYLYVQDCDKNQRIKIDNFQPFKSMCLWCSFIFENLFELIFTHHHNRKKNHIKFVNRFVSAKPKPQI